MTLNQINKLRMYQATMLVLSNYSELYAGVAPLVQASQKLTAAVNSIEENRQVQELATSGLTREKEDLKERLTTQVLKVSAALVAYATSVGNEDLKTKAHYKPSRLSVASDPVLADIAGLIANLVVPYIDELSIYFVDQAAVDLLNQYIDEFRLAIPQNRVATSSRKNSTKNLNLLFQSTNKLLKEELDLLMLPFQYSQPDFYDQYRNARIIVDYTGRRSQTEDTTTEPQQPA